jgi:hypothetical protein
MSTITVEIPIPPEVPSSGTPARRDGLLDGQVWGLVDTSKVNADRFLSELRTLVEQEHHAAGFVHYRKPTPGVPLSAEQLARLSEACRAVVIAFGD